MAANARRGGGDRVLESRHLVGLFLGVVLLCGVFFTLGYVMGRTQYGGAVHASDSPFRTAPSAPLSAKSKDVPAAKPAPSDPGWDFYDNKKTASDHLEPAPAPAAAPAKKSPASVPAVATKSPNSPPAASARNVAASPRQPERFQPPALGKNSIVLQVAAVKVQRDAMEMADAIQQKKLPSFVATSPADNFYHVQVGPYPDMAAAENAKRALEQLGFKPIIKR
ncbi:MAG: SPOR domain-containing protein [Candidatus Acidiferrales bacterium]